MILTQSTAKAQRFAKCLLLFRHSVVRERKKFVDDFDAECRKGAKIRKVYSADIIKPSRFSAPSLHPLRIFSLSYKPLTILFTPSVSLDTLKFSNKPSFLLDSFK